MDTEQLAKSINPAIEAIWVYKAPPTPLMSTKIAQFRGQLGREEVEPEKTVTLLELSARVPCIFSPLLYRLSYLSINAEARI